MYSENDNERSKPDRVHYLRDIVTAISAVLTIVIGGKIDGFEWIAQIGVVLLIIVIFLMIWESAIGIKARVIFRKYEDRRQLRKHYNEYERLFEKSTNTFQDVFEKVQNLEWGSKRPPTYGSIRNKISVLNHDLNRVSGNSGIKLIFLNTALRSIFEHIDSYLSYCDNFIVNGETRYKDKRQEIEILKLVAQFEKFRDDHNDLCDSINRDLKSVQLVPLYSANYCFATDDRKTHKAVD